MKLTMGDNNVIIKLQNIISRYKGEANFTLSNIVTAVVSMLTGIVSAIFISPEDMGVIETVLLVSTYVSFLQLGVFNGINRNLAFYRAQGDLIKAQKEIDTSHTVSFIVSSVGAIIGLGILLVFIIQGKKPVYLWSAGLLLVTLILQPPTNHFENTFRSGQQFGKLGTIKNIQSFVYAIISFLPVVLGYVGRIIANAVNIIVGYYLRSKYVPYKHQGKGDLNSLKDLISAGFPLLLGGYIWTVFVAADRTYIAAYLSSYDMGLYTIAGYVMSIISVLPTALNSLLYPKAAAKYGATGNKRDLLSFWRKSILLFAAVLIPVCLVSYFLLPPLVHWILPQYVAGIPAAQITLLSCLTFISMGPSVIFGTLKKNYGYIIAVGIALGAFWLLAYFGKNFITTIEDVAYLRFSISFCLMIFVIIYSYILIKK